jgi:hypothetical protein
MPKDRKQSEPEPALELPRSICILGHTYDVALTDLSDVPEATDPKSTLGISIHNKLLIRVRNDAAQEAAFSTFVHEVAHAVAAQGGAANLVPDKFLETACDLAGATVMCLIAGGVLHQRPGAQRGSTK